MSKISVDMEYIKEQLKNIGYEIWYNTDIS